VGVTRAAALNEEAVGGIGGSYGWIF